MPKRSMRPCKVPGCPNLVEGPGYCANHAARADEDAKARFKALDKRVPDELRRFYSSSKWTAASKLHRQTEPLCRRCKDKGRVACGELTHHNPPLEELLREGKNPLNDEYLETLCHNCHQVELSAKGRPLFYKSK
jgi:5-methylcytosine-specific restriction protein A